MIYLRVRDECQSGVIIGLHMLLKKIVCLLKEYSFSFNDIWIVLKEEHPVELEDLEGKLKNTVNPVLYSFHEIFEITKYIEQVIECRIECFDKFNNSKCFSKKNKLTIDLVDSSFWEFRSNDMALVKSLSKGFINYEILA